MSLQDDHIWSLAQRFTEESQIWTLGLQVLKLPEYQVASIWNKKKPDPNLTARELLREWSLQYEDSTEAYATLCDALAENNMSERAALLKRKAEDEINITPHTERLNEICELTKQSLRSKPFCLAIGKEWEEKQRKMNLRDIHTKLSWTRKHRKTSGFKQRDLEDITQILNEEQLGEDGPVRILVQAGGGMGKSTEMKHLAISWADGTSEELKKFDFVFHIALKHVKRNSGSIEDIIIAQHSRLKAKKVKPAEIRSILEGDTNKVLLLLDGHDEYKTGYNVDIDEAIRKESLGDIWLILTSRETEQLYDVKKYMDAEVEIQGFNDISVKDYVFRHMDDDEKAIKLIKEAEARGMLSHRGIFNVPMLLTMMCSLYEGTASALPKTKTGLLGCIVQKCVNREAIRSEDKKTIAKAQEVFNTDKWPPHISEAFLKVGELAWEKLNEPGKNLIFDKSEILERAGPVALELGLLFGTEIPQGEELDVLCFQHLMLQEFAAAVFISRQDADSLRKLFPRWEVLLKHKDVLSFVYGLSDHADDVIDLICDRGATFFTETALKEFQQECWNPDLADLPQIECETHRQTHVILYHIDELIRKVKSENGQRFLEEIFNLRNRHLSVCNFDTSDFILSRIYVIRQSGTPSISLICPDPTRCYATNDPVPYVIGNPHGNQFFHPLSRIIQTLNNHHSIVITHLYSPNMCLKERNSNLEGHLVLDVSSDHHDIFTIIKNISLLNQRIFITKFKMYLPDKKIVDERCAKQVQRWINFSSNVKALRFDGFKLPAFLIEHIAKELDGEVEFQYLDLTLSDGETEVLKPSEERENVLRLVFNDQSIKVIKTLVSRIKLPQLKVLNLLGLKEPVSFVILLGSSVYSLEELSLKNSTLNKQNVNKFLDILTKGGFPKLRKITNSKYVNISIADVTILSNYGLEINKLDTLTKLKSVSVITDGYLALENNILSKTKLNEADARSLIHEMLPTVTELDLSNETLTGCLGDFLKSDIYLNLRILDLCNTNLCDDDIKSLGALCSGQRRLNILKLSGNTLTNNISHLVDLGLKNCPELLLDDTKLSRNDVKVLSAAAQKGALRGWRTLNLSKSPLTDVLGDIIMGISFNRLQSLHLAHTCLSQDDVRALSMTAKRVAERGLFIDISSLDLSGNTLTDSIGDLLANELEWLESLLLEDTKLSIADVRALSTAAWEDKLGRLETLNLSKNTLTDTMHGLLEGIYTRSHGDPRLATLLLEDTKLSIADVRALSTAAWRLHTLNLSNNTLTDSMSKLLAYEFERLHMLVLEDTKLSISDVQALSIAKRKGKLPLLKTLNLSKNTLTDTLHDLFEARFARLDDPLELFRSKFIRLETLLLEDTKLSISDARALFTVVREGKLPGLRTLNLSKNTLTDTLHDLFEARFTVLETLQSLLLEDTKLSVNDVQALSAVVRDGKLPGLRTLNLSRNTLTDTMGDLLKDKLTNLERLTLDDIKLSNNDLCALNAAVVEGKLQSLKSLNLSENNLDGEHLHGNAEIHLGAAVEDLIQSCIKQRVTLVCSEERVQQKMAEVQEKYHEEELTECKEF